jgi:hypothetical protein
LNNIKGDFILSNEDWERGVNDYFVAFFDRRKFKKYIRRRLSINPNVRAAIGDFESRFNESEYFFDDEEYFSQENSYLEDG